MDFKVTSYLPILLLVCVIEANNSSRDDETRQPRVRGRIVKLYSGTRPDPIVCTNEGFKGDPNNCAVFYRCMKSGRGKYTAFKFQCPPGTVYDPDTEVCNHPQSTKRSECREFKEPTSPQDEVNEVNEVQELPIPIITKEPIYTPVSTPKVTNRPFIQDLTTNQWLGSTTTILPISTSRRDQEITSYPWTSSTQNIFSVTPPLPLVNPQSTHEAICTSDGFMGDNVDCHKFYRCVGNQRSGFTKYQFSCSEPTIWDDDIKSCNHPWAVKRSRCGRSDNLDDTNVVNKTPSISEQTTPNIILVASTSNVYSDVGTTVNSVTPSTINKPDIQNQLQISYGTNIHQSQIQISNNSVIQNQTQINYGDRINNADKGKNKQDQYQISQGSAISQSQTQISYGNEVIQTQVQIDHSKQSSQSQSQITEVTTPISKSPNAHEQNVSENNQNINNICSRSGFMGDYYDCKKFYRCVDNGKGSFTRHDFSCGEGTFWDQTIEACNHAWLVKSCGSTLSHHETTTKPSSSTPSYTTTHRYPTTSNKTNENPTTEGTHPNDYLDDVGYFNNATATLSPIDVTKPATDVIHYNGTICRSNGFIGDVENCQVFYSCVENGNGGYTKYEFKCGEGTLWDADIGACNHAWAVKSCGGKGSSSTPYETTSIKPITTSTSKVTTSIYTTSSISISSTHVTIQNNDYDMGYGNNNNKPSKSTIKPSNLPPDHNVRNECHSSGFMGDNADCKKFYRCVDSGNGSYIRYEFTCGEGTAWDSQIESCNHAWAVECKNNGIVTSATEITTQKRPIATHEETDDGYNMPENDKDSNVNTHRTTLSTSTIRITDSNNKCKKSGFMGDVKDCNKFYRCVDNGDGSFTLYEFTCGKGTVWDQKVVACNYAWAVEKCGSYYEAHHGVATTSGYNVTVSDEEPVVGYPMNEDEGTDNINVTTTETILIPSLEVEPTEKTSTTHSVHDNDISEDCEKEGFVGDSRQCKKFYRCVSNGHGGFHKHVFMCGEGTYWNQIIQACDHASSENSCKGIGDHMITKDPLHENGQTDVDTTTKATLTTNHDENIFTSLTEKPQNIGTMCHSEGFFGDQNDCHKFYRCVNDGKGSYIKHDFICGEGTIWDPESMTCAHNSERNGCLSNFTENSIQTNEPSNQNEIPYTTSTSNIPHKTSTEKLNIPHQTTTENISSGTYKCKSEGFHTNPGDCRKFIRCVNNGDGSFVKYDFTCGEGTVWVQELLACDHDDGKISCPSHVEWTTKPQINFETSSNLNNASNPTAMQTESTDKTYQPENQTESFIHDEISGITQNSITSTMQATTMDPKEGTSTVSEDTCKIIGFFGNTKDCTKFYRCVDNTKGGFTKYDFKCGDGTIWDQDLNTCNHPQDVVNPSCNQEHGETSANTNASSGTSSTSTTISSSQSLSTQSSGSSTTQSSESITSLPGTTSAGSSSNCTQEETSKKPGSKNVTCTQAGYYPDLSDCKKFYRCVDWDGKGEQFSVYFFECGEGTIWDPALDTCNHEESVYPPRDCSNTQTENSNSSQKPTTTESSTTQESTTTERTTTESTSSENTTTQQPTTTGKTTTEQSTTSEQTSTQQSTTSEISTTDRSITTKHTTMTPTSVETTTQVNNTTEQTTSVTESTTTQETTTTGNTSQESTTVVNTTPQCTTEKEGTTTESTNSSTTTDSTSTTEVSTTDRPTLSTTTTETSEQTSTTENLQETTTPNNSSSSCPEIDDDQYLFVCPTSFKRHPKYCNLFYQCTEDEDSHEVKVAVFNCPNNTIYDENKVQCVEENKAEKKCSGEIALKHRVQRLGADYKEPIVVTNDAHKCLTVGHMPFEKNSECSAAFLKCEKTRFGRIRGFVHRCPQDYMYWSISRRCERKEVIRDCKRTINNWSGRWEIPIDRHNVAW